MEDQTTKQILIDVQLKSDNLKSEIVSLNTTLDTLLVNQVKLKGAGKQNTEEFIALASQVRNTKTEIRTANKEIDNTSKALNAGNNSIAQNRALLSLLTSQYVKLSQEQGKTAAGTIALGNQINNLTAKLKTQEGVIGQTNRNVGNYTQSILQAIPGMGRYSTMITNASRAFNLMGMAVKNTATETAKTEGVVKAATVETEQLGVAAKLAATGEAELATGAVEAEAGVTGLSGAALIAAGAIAAVVAVIATMITYLKNLDGVTDEFEQGLAGLKAGFFAAGSSIQEGKYSDLGRNMKQAAVEAAGLTEAFQDLGDAQLTQSVQQQKVDEQIAILQLKMRDRRNTPEQERQYYNQIQQISQDNYVIQKDLADKQYDIAIQQAVVGRYLTKQELENLYDKGVAYAIQLENDNKILSGQTKAIAAAQNAQTAAERAKEAIQQRAQNRLDAINMKAEAAAEKDLQKQEEIKRQIEQINSERIASIVKMLGYEQEAFGKEISATDEHYRQLIFKQQQFIEKNEALQRSKKSSPKVKALAGQAIKASEDDIKQIKRERYSESERLLVEHNKKMIEITEKGALDLKVIQHTAIDNEQRREIAAINDQFEAKLQAFKKKDAEYQDAKAKLENEIDQKGLEATTETNPLSKKIAKNELQALKATLNSNNSLLDQNFSELESYEKKKQKDIEDTNQKFEIQNKLIQDQIDIINAGNKKGFTGGKDNPFNKTKETAEIKQLDDQKTKTLQDKGLDGDKNADGTAFDKSQVLEKLSITVDFEQKRKDIEDQFRKGRKEAEIAAINYVANTAFTIIGNGIKAAGQAKEVQLSKDKAHELSNASLTSAQKIALENKYRILEGQAKVKAFKQDQKLSEVKIVISTAEAIMKAAPNYVSMAIAAAMGIAEFAIVASQKPPAYAQGGTFKSDGKGSVLPGYSKRDNVNAQLRSGEAVIVSEAVRDPYARSILSAINTSFGGRSFSEANPGRGYAIGGIVSDGNNSNRYYAQPQEGTKNLANTIAFSLINNFPPVMVDVKDINNQQGILVTTKNRVRI